jgi:VIT1/CCC1 family predicted Fe2+/Mn2+ transporter
MERPIDRTRKWGGYPLKDRFVDLDELSDDTSSPTREFDILWSHYTIRPQSREEFITIESDHLGIRRKWVYGKVAWVAINLFFIVFFLVGAIFPLMVAPISESPFAVICFILALIILSFLAFTLMPIRQER